MRRKSITTLVAFVGIVVILFGLTVGFGNKPNLGLDLQGGVSVVLQPVKNGKKQSNVSKEALDQTKQIIDTRVNAIGVGEPDITIQGSTVVVQLPGIKDQQRVLDLVGKTAELRFRPLLEEPLAAPPADAEAQIKKLRAELKMPDGVSAVQVLTDEQAKSAASTTPTTPGATTTAPVATTAPAPTTTAATSGSTSTVKPGTGTGGGRSLKGASLSQATPSTAPSSTTAPTTSPPTTAAAASTTTAPVDKTPKNQWGIDTTNPDFLKLGQLETQLAQAKEALTPPEKDTKDATVVLLGRPDANGARERYKLGPTLLTGSAIEDAKASIQNGQWIVNPVFKGGKNGIDLFNAAAKLCFNKDPLCPTGRLAVVLDNVVVSGPPTIQAESFARDQIQISGSFKEQDARDLALALRYGSLPLTLVPQQVQTVSATLGSGALHAGLLAGAIGLALVCLYIVVYYRLLGLMTVCELCLTAMTLWVIIAFFGEYQGLTLTLSGIVGIVVSIGVSLDSSVVYFENLKEDVRHGRSMRSTVDKSFLHAYKTIIKADVSSLIGATILYVLSVGPVRGFAFYLGLSTIIDLATTYFWMRNVTSLLTKSKLGLRPKIFGIPLDSALRGADDPTITEAAVNEGGALA